MTFKSADTGNTPRKLGPLVRPVQSGDLQPLRDRRKLDLVMDAVSGVELAATDAWGAVAPLSDSTHVNGIEAVPEGIFGFGEHGFTAIATVYLDLNYRDKGRAFSASDSFPAQVQGHFAADGKAVVDAVSVDTTSFYS